MRIGLVSDTHGRFDPSLPLLFARCDRIIHAGDVVGREILALLEALAPLTAVRGNCDTGDYGTGLPEEATLQLEGTTLLVLHELGKPEKPVAAAKGALGRTRAGIVVFGHSHQPEARLAGGVLYINPGSAGPRRFELPRCAGILTLERGRARVELFDLELAGVPLLCEPFECELPR